MSDLEQGDRVFVQDAYKADVEYVDGAIVGVMTSVGPVAASGLREVRRDEVVKLPDEGDAIVAEVEMFEDGETVTRRLTHTVNRRDEEEGGVYVTEASGPDGKLERFIPFAGFTAGPWSVV